MRTCPILISAVLAGIVSAGASAQKIAVTPDTVLTDEVADIRVTGLQPGSAITLRADLRDGADHAWQSEADFVADGEGGVDTAKQAPLRGSYRIVSAMGLIWSMRPAEKETHVYQAPHQLAGQIVHFHLVQDGKETASADLTQLAIAAGIRQIKLEGALHGILFLPAGDDRHPAVLVLGGSEGGLPARRAAWLASHGYAALALAYFHYEDLPDQLHNIPLEYFGQALAWLAQRPEVDANRIGVMGVSRGGELALQLGSMYPTIHAVVAYVPSNVRRQACCGRNLGGAWTWSGQPVTWAMPERGSDAATIMRATIAVEHTHGPVLMIAGDDDGVWPSASMVGSAAARLREAHFAYAVTVLTYPHAGHRAGLPEIMPDGSHDVSHPVSGTPTEFGGTPEGNALSSLDAIPKVLEFLRTSLGNPAQAVPSTSVPTAERR